MNTDITGELWVILRGKFCDQLNDCQLVRHQLTFNYTDIECTSVRILIPSSTTTLPLPDYSVRHNHTAPTCLFRPPQPHCPYQSCVRAFGLKIIQLLFFGFVFVTSLFNVRRSNNYNDDHVCLSVCPSVLHPSFFLSVRLPLTSRPHWGDFHEILYWIILRKFVEKSAFH